jgi:hypothetical protein
MQSHKLGKDWIASSQGLLAMTGARDARIHRFTAARQAYILAPLL